MREILRQLLPEDELERVLPSPTEISPQLWQTHGLDGIADPRDRITLSYRIANIQDADRLRKPRNPEDMEQVQALLGKAGYRVVELSSAQDVA
jgi:hypothetical protein